MQEQIYKINNIKSFEPKHIFDCGQCFRWNEMADGSYTGTFGRNVLNVKKENKEIRFKGLVDGNIEDICNKYFDLDFIISFLLGLFSISMSTNLLKSSNISFLK